MHILIDALLNIQGRSSTYLQVSLSVQLAPFQCSVKSSVKRCETNLLSLDSAISPIHRICWAFLGFSFPVPEYGNSLKAVNWAHYKAHLFLFVSCLLRITIVGFLMPLSWKPLLVYFFQLFFYFRWKGKSSPFYFIFARSRISESEVAQSCPTLCDPMDCSLPGSSVHGILQARILEWVAISFSRGSSRPRDWTRVSRIAVRHFNLWATREAQKRNK